MAFFLSLRVFLVRKHLPRGENERGLQDVVT